MVRSPAKLADRNGLPAWLEVREVNLEDASSLSTHLAGCDAAFYLVHSMNSAGSEYAERDQNLALQFATAARDAGVQRIIYLGGLGETGSDLSEHLSSRREVEEALASTGVPVTVLRAAMIIGSGSASFEILRYLVERLPIMITPRWVSTPCQPIAVRNRHRLFGGNTRRPRNHRRNLRHRRP
ncbi:MAG: NAD(P)H-binding protein [Acidobacteriota bacterium]